MAHFRVKDVMKSLPDYTVCIYEPELPQGRKNLDQPAAFHVAQLAVDAYYNLLTKGKTKAAILDHLLICQGIRASVDFDVLLEPSAHSCGGKRLQEYQPEVIVAYKSSLNREALFEAFDTVQLERLL